MNDSRMQRFCRAWNSRQFAPAILRERMLKVYTCLTTDHDVGLVALAIVICALASFAAVKLLDHVGHSHGTMRRGFGCWSPP